MFFSTILCQHLERSVAKAEGIIKVAVKKAISYYDAEQSQRQECLEEREWYISQKSRLRMRKAHQKDDGISDPSLLALDALALACAPSENVHSRPMHKKPSTNRCPSVLLPSIQPVPKYDAWIPVLTNYWAGKELHVEPYMPFLGDQDDDCELAFEVFEDMADDAGKELDLSDGEVNADGTFAVPRDDIDRVEYYSIPQVRWRQGTRQAILTVLDQFTNFDDTMWRILSAALGIKDLRRIKAVARVAQQRRRDFDGRMLRREREKGMTDNLCQAVEFPQNDEMPLEEEWSACTSPLKHFCFICHVFPCPQHANFDVEPVIPIRDVEAEQRKASLRLGTAKICSKNCAINMNPSVDSPSLNAEWSAEEILLLREAVPIFGLDSCRLAIVVGSRSCIEVFTKLKDPIEADIANYEIQKAKQPQRIEVTRKKTGEAQGKKEKAKLSNKTVVESHKSTNIDQDFSPCHHNGPCTQDNCTCVKKGMHCETTCGCNYGRYVEGGKTGGIIWNDDSDGDASLKCQNRHNGCGCTAGNCDTVQCPCWDQNRACSPDTCECDSNVLPQHISIAKRRCRNIPTSIAKHKKTFVGKSEVHGFGLFAGERFESGDLVGVYSGQLIDTRLADMIGRLYDATDRTYIFNVTESLVIDGGLLGSKAKFCNHTKPGARENCASRLVRVRGDAYVALFCKRRVEAGEEFLFDYRFTGEVPAWAKDDKGKSLKKW